MSCCRWLALLPLCWSLALTGCAKRTLYPVRGKVVFADGSDAVELSGGMVEFESVDGKSSSRGEIKEDATFEMGTQGLSDGAHLGKNRVLVMPPAGHPGRPRPAVMDRRFEQYVTSGLTVDVVEGMKEVNLQVDRARK